MLLAAYVVVGHGPGRIRRVRERRRGAEPRRPSARPGRRPPRPWRRILPQGLATPLRDWFVLELAGVAAGRFCSAWLAGRVRGRVAHGPRVTTWSVFTRRLPAACHGRRREVRARLHERPGADRRGAALGRQLDLHRDGFAAAYVVAPLARRFWQ